MKTNKIIFLTTLIIISLVFFNCSDKTNNKVTHKNDFQAYLTLNDNNQLNDVQKEIDFWQNKLEESPNQSSYLITLASYHSQLFDLTGKIDALYKSEELLLEANQKFVEQHAGIHRAIARNYISQHRFKEALTHLEQAEKLGEKLMGTNKMLFDVHMELGNYKTAQEKLSIITSNNDFDYLIRAAKWNDYKGDLDTTISFMERAMKIAEEEKDKTLKIWVYSNIADYYGHAGRIEDSYAYYLKTLKEDPNNTHALKGIAWIAFSYERNPELALDIINAIELKKVMPDIYLLKAEIAEFQKNEIEQEKAISTYNKILATNDYGAMYHAYNISLWAEKPKLVANAIKLAQIEVQNRPTPEAHDLLAWSYYKNGEKEKALEIIQKHTIGQSFEPIITYHAAEILKANNQITDLAMMKKELQESVFELGPGLEKPINNL